MNRKPIWIHGPVTDALLAWLWLPVFVVAHALASHGNAVPTMMGAAFIISFAHQPLTLGLVYGDREQFTRKRRLYLIAPPVFVVAVTVGMVWSLTALAVVAALWNAEHTLMQRFGITRIYGRKLGDTLGGLEKWMYVSWLAFALTWLPAFVNLPEMAYRLGFGDRNRRGLELLYELRGIARTLLVAVALVALVLTARWVMLQRRLERNQRTTAKYQYVVATFGLVVAVMIDPAAGFVSYIAAHALEYFVIVDASLRKRVHSGDDARVIRAVRTPWRRAAVYTTYLAAVIAVPFATFSWMDGRAYAWLVVVFGGMHVLYDGFVWKLRRPATAASLGIPITLPAPAGSGVTVSA